MNEEFLHFAWKYSIFDKKNLKTTCGKKLKIIFPGIHNYNQGPDFLNARIQIDDVTWAGNVEIHSKASDWFAHGHGTDYENIILHVVGVDDAEIFRKNRQKIPAFLLNPLEDCRKRFHLLKNSEEEVACAKIIGETDSFLKTHLISVMNIERLKEKTEFIKQILDKSGNNWEEAIYHMMGRQFGAGLNSIPFEMLTRSIPYNVIIKTRHNLNILEAILFGQAGFLSDEPSSEYEKYLNKEYGHQSKKFGLKPIEQNLWKYLRTRPCSFPQIKISQFAGLLHKNIFTLESIKNTENLMIQMKETRIRASSFWDQRYTFKSREHKPRIKYMGGIAINNLIINTVCPTLFLYGSQNGIQKLKDNAIGCMESIEYENNRTTRMWNNIGINAANAFDSQGLLHLHQEYCQKKRCLECFIGKKFIAV